jgi:2',3'-cyclic-nucleotide 2'-phosphodiesterase
MNILMVGDIFAESGRAALAKLLPQLRHQHAIDFTVVNIENAAGGFGVTPQIARSCLEQLGVDVLTSGNHIWAKKEAIDYIGVEPRLLRPANFPDGVPGRGSYAARTEDGRTAGVINVMGRVFMTPIDDPFAVVLREIEAMRQRTRVIFVDMHAEATSEKIAMGWHLDGKVAAVIGTHTHVQTADDRILPRGTAYLTDVGMTGPHDSVIGVEIEPALARFLNGMPSKFEVATGNPRLNAVVVEADERSGLATSIERLSYSLQELEQLALDMPSATGQER